MASEMDAMLAVAAFPSLAAVHGDTVTYGGTGVTAIFAEINSRDVPGQGGTWRIRTAKLDMSTDASAGGVATAGTQGDVVTVNSEKWSVSHVIERHPGAKLISLGLERRELIEETGPKFRRELY